MPKTPTFHTSASGPSDSSHDELPVCDAIASFSDQKK
jgi:hypothetical protein